MEPKSDKVGRLKTSKRGRDMPWDKANLEMRCRARGDTSTPFNCEVCSYRDRGCLVREHAERLGFIPRVGRETGQREVKKLAKKKVEAMEKTTDKIEVPPEVEKKLVDGFRATLQGTGIVRGNSYLAWVKEVAGLRREIIGNHNPKKKR